MIISHQHKFIFLKTSKTAGTSIEIALSKFCGDSDVITPLIPDDEILRGQYGGRKPQNYQTEDGEVLFNNHMPARKVKQRIPPDIWRSYYKFCVERNPWDRVISAYYWNHKEEPRPPLKEFIQSPKFQLLKKKGFKVYTIHDEVVVDRVCLYENLPDELEVVRQKLGLPEPITLPHAKGNYRKDRRPYQEVFSEEDKKYIAEFFAREIEMFGYQY